MVCLTQIIKEWNVSIQYHFQTLLLFACSQNHEAIAAELIEAGADVNAVATVW